MPEVVKADARKILKKLISERGIKKNYLADKIGISPQSMSNLLSGKLKFTADLAIKLGKALDVPYDIFLTKSYS